MLFRLPTKQSSKKGQRLKGRLWLSFGTLAYSFVTVFVFYQASLESVIRYGTTVRFGNLPGRAKSELLHLVQTAMKMIGQKDHQNLQSLFDQLVSHILYWQHELLPSGRQTEAA